MSITPREQATIDLKIARADAIFDYVGVEQALSILLATLLGVSHDQAGIVFFNIIGSRSRDKIFEGLVEQKFGNEYDAYWYGISGTPGVKAVPGLSALIQQLSTVRNFIVHWGVSMTITDGGAEESLIPPNYWGYARDPRSLTIPEIREFSKKARFVSGSIMMFNLVAGGGLPASVSPGPWPEIFQQPCTYPPSDTHPLARKT